MDETAPARLKYTPWRSRSMNGSLRPPMEGAEWDRLLSRLGLTDSEALAAIRERGEAGQPIRRFVREAFRDHFVPEDVLLAINLHRTGGEEQL